MAAVTRVVLKQGVNRATVEDAAWNNDWLLWDELPRTESTPHEIVYVLDDQKNSIHYVEDFILGLPYLVLRGDQAPELATQARSSLPSYTSDELLALLNGAGDRDACIYAIYAAAAGAPAQFDVRFFDRFSELARHASADVRGAVIVGMGYLGWPQRQALLEQLAKDSDAEVRESAELMIEGVRLETAGR